MLLKEPSYKDRITSKLTVRFNPTHLEVLDESHKHAGHGAFNGTGETHFRIIISSKEFTGLSRVSKHRLINETLAEELLEQIHALSITANSPI